jgi:hypothetical protein
MAGIERGSAGGSARGAALPPSWLRHHRPCGRPDFRCHTYGHHRGCHSQAHDCGLTPPTGVAATPNTVGTECRLPCHRATAAPLGPTSGSRGSSSPRFCRPAPTATQSPLQGRAGAPLARQRGGRPRSRDTPAESGDAPNQRRSFGREGSRRPRTAARAQALNAAKTVPGRVARDTPLRRSLRSLRPCPATGPARHKPMARGTPARRGAERSAAVTARWCAASPRARLRPASTP